MSTQEEADTRLLFRAAQAAHSGFLGVIISSPDTNLAVIAVLLARKIPSRLIFHPCTKQRTHFIDLTSLSESLGQSMNRGLVGLHAITGCDSLSTFSGQGKKKGFDFSHQTLKTSLQR